MVLINILNSVYIYLLYQNYIIRIKRLFIFDGFQIFFVLTNVFVSVLNITSIISSKNENKNLYETLRG